MTSETHTEDTETEHTEPVVREIIANPQGLYRGLGYIVLSFAVVAILFPFYWLLVLSLTPKTEIATAGLLPGGFNWRAFVTVFQEIPFHVYIFNSMVIAGVTTIIVLILGSLAGYVFGRFEFRGRTPLLISLLIISYFPPAAFFVPLFQLLTGNTTVFGVSSPSLYNTPGSIVSPLSALTMPFAIFVLTVFYDQIPDGLEDAARVEGCTRIGALFRVIMPLSAPGVATAGVLTFIAVYNEFFFSFLMTDGQAQHWAPLVWGIVRFQGTAISGTTAFNLMAAASLIGILPIAIIIYVAQDRIVSGLTSGALKE